MTVSIDNLNRTWANSAITHTGMGLNVTGIAYNPDSKIFALKFNGNTVFSIDTAGTVTGNITVISGNTDPRPAFRQANLAFDKANTSYNTAVSAFDKANNSTTDLTPVYAWTNTTLGYANTHANAVGVSANAHADAVGVSANLYAASLSSTTSLTPANNWANAVGVSANSYAAAVGVSANSYAASLTPSLTPANNWANSVGVSANAYTDTTVNSAQANSTVIPIGLRSYPSSGNIGIVSLVNVVPRMIGDNSNSCIVVSSSYYSLTPPWGAFVNQRDPSISSGGWITNATSTGWIYIRLPSSKTIYGYGIVPWSADTWPSRIPKNWTFEGSNDGASWTVLDTRAGYYNAWTDMVWQHQGERFFQLASPATYQYYRLNVSANNGDTYMAIMQLFLYGVTDPIKNGIFGLFLQTPAGELVKLPWVANLGS